jgi:GINS complex subunit 1
MSGLDLSHQLATECKRSSSTQSLYKYNDALVRQISREIRALDSILSETLASVSHLHANEIPQTQLCAMTMIQAMMERDKRCLLAYHNHRINLLKDLFWRIGGALPQILSDVQIREKLSPHEVDFMREYAKLVTLWREDLLDVVDLAMGTTSPPKDINVQVVVRKDCGVVNTELGEIDFRKGQRYLVRRSDVEHLILQGYLGEI